MQLTVYSEQELKEIQKIEKAALAALTGVCDSLGISFFAIGGTALGAIRHGGFIPWDDDIDLGMTRENYRRFLKEAPALLPREYVLQSPYGDENAAYPYAKLRVNGTAFVEYSNRRVDMHHGVYIDLFPFDEVPDDEALNRQQFEAVQRLSRLFVWRQTPDVYAEPVTPAQKGRAVARRAVYRVLRLLPYRLFLEKLEAVMTAYNGTGQQAMACLLFPRRKCEYGLKSTLFPTEKHRFEELMIDVPRDFDTYLTTHYGDWRQLPPPEKRYGHKPYHVNLHGED